jgi:CBS domain-containing protein
MKIARVLGEKNVQGAVSVKANQSMGELVLLLNDMKIGAVIVRASTGALAGVISERDVVRALAVDGEICLTYPVTQYMTEDVQTTTREDTAVSVLERMTAGRFRHMPVLEGDQIVGVVSIGDIVKCRIEELQRDNEALAEFIRS